MTKPTTKPVIRLLPVALLALASGGANAQSLYMAQNQPDASQPVILLDEVSLHYVAEPNKRVFKKHDIITIIIDENSSQTSSQSLDTKKETTSDASIDAMVNWLKLLELRVRQGDITDTDLIDLTTAREFKGEGDYARTDQFSARITATVLDVKPNGTLVLQATKHIAKDTEISTLVLSGMAREDDVTTQNTILSSQLADLNIVLNNEGSVKKAAEKGLITRILDTVFAF